MRTLYLRLYEMDRTPSPATVENPTTHMALLASANGADVEWVGELRVEVRAELTLAEKKVVEVAFNRAAKEFEDALRVIEGNLDQVA